MRIHKTIEPNPASETEQLWVYNGLDCMVTLEVLNVIKPQLDELTSKTYQFELDLQGPILEMECRGVLIDLDEREKVAKIFEEKLLHVETGLAEILSEGLGVECNVNSPKQLTELLYGTLDLTPVKFKGKVTVNRQALEKLMGNFHAEPIIRHIFAIRDLKKKLGVLKTGLDADGRIRTGYNIAGTDTGRLSSYTSAFGSGTNLQNITGELRQIFVADPGWKLCYIDLEQAESRAVGAIIWNLFHDGRYLDACESGDLHTAVCRLCWEYLGWTGDGVTDKKIAKTPFYRHFDYRDAAKRLGHATNYFGKPFNIARQVHIEQQLVADFQIKYFKAFAGIPLWHQWVRRALLDRGFITTFLGRKRHFFGRRWDDDTLRAAIAYEPQSAVADLVNRGLLRIWRSDLPVQVLLQVHDALVFQYKNEEVIRKVMDLFEEEVPLLHNRSLKIPSEAFIGWNWAYASDKNPDGLIPFKGLGLDTRQRQGRAPTSFMDRRVF